MKSKISNQAQPKEAPDYIELKKAGTDTLTKFNIQHAKNILAYEEKQKVKSWVLPASSNYTFQHGNLIVKSGAGSNISTEAQGQDSKGFGSGIEGENAYGADTAQG